MSDKAVPIAGTVIGVGLNLTPCILFYEFFRGKRELSTIPEMMFIMGVFCYTTNLAYSFIINDNNMKISNLICDSLQVIYSITYLFYYAKKDFMTWLLYTFIALNLTFEILYIFANVIEYHTSNKFADDFTGYFNLCMTVINAGAPGQNIITVIKTNNFTLIPIWTIFAQLYALDYGGCMDYFLIIQKFIFLMVLEFFYVFYKLLPIFMRESVRVA